MPNARRDRRGFASIVLSAAVLLGGIASTGCDRAPEGPGPSGPQDLDKIRDTIPPRDPPEEAPKARTSGPARR